LGRHRGLALALAVSAAGLAVQCLLHEDELRRYDNHALPAFDAYVYMAMAERPMFFTVPPWGHRIVTPWLVHGLSRALPGTSTAGAFVYVTLGGLCVAGGLIYLFLRRLGHGERAALAAVAVFSLSGPVGETVAYRFLSEPLSLVLEVALLLALEAGAGIGVVALVLTTGALTKELFLLFLPLPYLVWRGRLGDRKAALQGLVAALPALVVTFLVRSWGPQAQALSTALSADVFWLAVYRILAGWPDWWTAVLLMGVLPLAFLGALRAASRCFLRRYGYLVLLTLALPFAASVYTGDSRTVPFFAQDVPRLLLFALPVLLPLALAAIVRGWPHLGPPPPLAPSARREVVAAAAALAVVAVPLLACDPYRRVDLRGPRDGRLLLALCRESLAFAQRLEKGRPVVYAPESRRFAPQRSDPHLLERMRWFLREGWGPMPHYGLGPVVTVAPRASILLPCLRPAALDAAFLLSAREPATVVVSLNGRGVGEVRVGSEAGKHVLRIPADALFRGDNLLELVAPAGVRFHELTLWPTDRGRASRQ
jgi:hypothetical protein